MKEEVAAHLGRSRCRGEGGDWGYKSPSFWGLSTEKDMVVGGMSACPSRSASYCLGMQGASTKGERLQWWPCLLDVTQWCFTFTVVQTSSMSNAHYRAPHYHPLRLPSQSQQ